MQDKKILYTVLSGDIAGGQMVCLGIMEASQNAGYKVLLLSQTEGPFTELVRSKGIKVYVIPLKRSFYFYKIPILMGILIKERINMVHSHDFVSGNILIRIAARLSNTPVISHMHIKNHYSNISRLYARNLDNITAGFCKKIIAVSHSIKKDLIEQGYPENNIEVIYNGIKIEEKKEDFFKENLLDDLYLREDYKIFLCAGRLCKNKGQEDLIHAAYKIVKEPPETCFIFAGEDIERNGLYKEELYDIVKYFKLEDNVRFLGLRKDTKNLLEISDCLILPSYVEGLRFVVLEAMAERKPVIAYSVDGVPEEVIDGQTGYLVNKGDIEALKEAILKIIKDPEKAKILGENGYNIVKQKFNLTDKANRILEIYREIV